MITALYNTHCTRQLTFSLLRQFENGEARTSATNNPNAEEEPPSLAADSLGWLPYSWIRTR